MSILSQAKTSGPDWRRSLVFR
nr:unnamed protein product [Callosobruchus chinensis]